MDQSDVLFAIQSLSVRLMGIDREKRDPRPPVGDSGRPQVRSLAQSANDREAPLVGPGKLTRNGF